MRPSAGSTAVYQSDDAEDQEEKPDYDIEDCEQVRKDAHPLSLVSFHHTPSLTGIHGKTRLLATERPEIYIPGEILQGGVGPTGIGRLGGHFMFS